MASMPAMRLLIATPLFPPDLGGPATYSKILKEALPERYIDVGVLSFGEVRHLPPVVRHLVYMWKVIEQGRRFDVIYAQDAVSVGWPVACANFFLRKPLVVKVVGDHVWEQGVQRFGVEETLDEFVLKKEGIPLYLSFLQTLRGLVLRQAKIIVVPSGYLKAIVTSWGVDPHKIKVIYNSFKPPSITITREEAKQKLSLDGTIVASAGRLVPWKGYSALVSLFPKLEKKLPGMRLLIIGEGPEREALAQQIRSLDLEKKITLLGGLPQERLWEYLVAADVFVLNTSYEGFSHQLLEVAALGTPIVTTNVGGNPEIITHEREGFLVEKDNEEELIEALVRAAGKEGGLFAEVARKKASFFSRERMVKDTEAVLRIAEQM